MGLVSAIPRGDMSICPICFKEFSEDTLLYEIFFNEEKKDITLGWEICPQESCIKEVKRRNLERHKEYDEFHQTN